MAAQQILFNEPARALPVGAEIDWDVVVDDDRKRGPHDRTRMSAGTIGSAEEIIKSGFHDHAGAVVFGESKKLPAEAFPVADDRVDEVLCRLPLDRHCVLQTGKRIVPRR